MSTLDIDIVRDDKENNMSNSDDQSKCESSEIIKIIELNLPVDFREDFLRLKMNLKLKKIKRQRLLEIIIEILKENGIDTEAW